MFEKFKNPIDKILIEKGISTSYKLLKPPSSDLGDFCLVVNQISGKIDPTILGESLVKEMKKIEDIDKLALFTTKGKKKKSGIIYLNFSIKKDKKRELQIFFIESVLELIFSPNYGYSEVNKGKVAVVEHTSANPISPLHVGNLRNSVLGDTFARILERTGYKVYRIFYVNDVGLQVSFVIIGYEIVKNKHINPPIKFDLWLGQIYAIMNYFFTIQGIKEDNMLLEISEDPYSFTKSEMTGLLDLKTKSLEEIDKIYQNLSKLEHPNKSDKHQLQELKRRVSRSKTEIKDMEKLYNSGIDLNQRYPELYKILHEGILKIDLRKKTAKYLRAYEKNSSTKITSLFKEAVNWILSSFQWTLRRYKIEFDKFDFESDVTASGLPDSVIDQLADSKNVVFTEGNAVRYSYPDEVMNDFFNETGLSKNDSPIKGKIPDLQLRRSDGTALYAAKDIAYSIKKYRDYSPDVIYNVISAEQSLPQFQLLLPLFELGEIEIAKRMKHYSYENVELRGRQMSGRLASYVTADEFYDETLIRARMAKRTADKQRSKTIPIDDDAWNKESEMLRAVTLASTRFPLLETSPKRKIELDLDRELDFRRNSGPFVQYAHARASGVIRKIQKEKQIKVSSKIDPSLIATDEVIDLLEHIKELQEKILQASENQDPSIIAIWTFQLAQKFMKFYERNPVFRAETEELLVARYMLVQAIRKGIASGLNILGIYAADQI